VPLALALLSRKGWWKSELVTSWCLVTPGLKPAAPGTWATSSGWPQSWPHLSCHLGNGLKALKLTAADLAGPWAFCIPAPVGGLFQPISNASQASTPTKCCPVSDSPLPSCELVMLKYQKGTNITLKTPENTKHELHYADPHSQSESQINTLQYLFYKMQYYSVTK